MMTQVKMACRMCGGQGEMMNPADRCVQCNGDKVVPEAKVLEVHIDKGMKNGQNITFSGESNQEPGVKAGDVVIQLHEKKHSVFKRRGDDLLMEIEIELVEALCGFRRVVKQLDGRQLVVTSLPGEVLADNDLRLIRGEGMPVYRDPYTRGNLYIKFSVNFPEANWTGPEELKRLETLLPPRRPQEQPAGEDVEEVELIEFDEEAVNGKQRTGSRSAYDEDEGRRGGGGGGVQCASQ